MQATAQWRNPVDSRVAKRRYSAGKYIRWLRYFQSFSYLFIDGSLAFLCASCVHTAFWKGEVWGSDVKGNLKVVFSNHVRDSPVKLRYLCLYLG